MNYSSLTLELQDPSWASFVRSVPGATPFHHTAWTSLIADCYRLPGFVVAILDADGEIAAGAAFFALHRGRRWVSLPFTDFCPPLGDRAACDHFLAVLETMRREQGLRSIEIRAPIGEPAQGTIVGFRHELALDGDPAEIMERFDRSQVQRGIRKAQREGVRVRWGSSRRDVDVFYSLHLATRRRLGVPIQPRAFFDGLWERLVEPGLGAIVIAEIHDRPLAAAVFLGWGDTLVYKFGASDRSAWSFRPNHALFWDTIRWACEKGFSVLDFGRTDLDNDGLRSFKAGWGTFESPLVYSTLGELRPARAGGAASKALGGLIRHSPGIVCRQLGERLYRYAA